MMIIIIYKN